MKKQNFKTFWFTKKKVLTFFVLLFGANVFCFSSKSLATIFNLGAFWKSAANGAVLVKNINTINESSQIYYITAFGSKVIFQVDDGVHGAEPWVSDGTEAGTKLLIDIKPGSSNSSYPNGFTEYNGNMYFQADDSGATYGFETYKTDGTPGGSGIAIDFNPGSTGTNIQNFGASSFGLFVAIDDNVHGLDPWISDGTFAGSSLLKDTNPIGDSYPGSLIEISPKNYFLAMDGSFDLQIWATDGTAVGTSAVTAGPIAVQTGEIFKSNGKIYFNAVSGNGHGAEVWVSDGTPGGTNELLDINAGAGGSDPNTFTELGTKTLFSAYNPANGFELWVTDGTGGGTNLVKDINPGAADSFSVADFNSFNSLKHIAIGSNMFFLADDGTNGIELWKSDGTLGGTSLVKDINPGAGSIEFTQQFPAVLGTEFLFFADDGVHGSELWKSDGTLGGTVLVKDIYPGAVGNSTKILVTAGAQVFFVANDGIHGAELWKSDGTSLGTVMVKDIYGKDASGRIGSTAIELGGEAFFPARDLAHGSEFWKTNGTNQGTLLLDDINLGVGHGSTGPNLLIGSTIYFTADDGIHGSELWKTDGVSGHAVLVKDICPGSGDGISLLGANFAAIGTQLYFIGDDCTGGSQLWTSDGTTLGTSLVKDVNPGGFSNDVNSLTVNGSNVYFIASDATSNGADVWVSDGTTVGTVKLTVPTATLSGNLNLTALGADVYFMNISTSELWKTNGTPVGTTLVKQMNVLGNPNDMYGLMSNGTSLYFFANDAVNGIEPWISDGTGVGTVMLKDINSSGDSSSIYYTNYGLSTSFVSMGSDVYFCADDGTNGSELWKSNGTGVGTVLLKNINVSGNGCMAIGTSLTDGSTLYFGADDGSHGLELWKTDGTGGGTKLVKDINHGAQGSDPFPWIFLGGNLLFYADDGLQGAELWKTVP